MEEKQVSHATLRKQKEIREFFEVFIWRPGRVLLAMAIGIAAGLFIGICITGPIAGTIVRANANKEWIKEFETSFVSDWEESLVNTFWSEGLNQTGKEKYLKNVDEVTYPDEKIMYYINQCVVYYRNEENTISVIPYTTSEWDILYPYKMDYGAPLTLRDPVCLSTTKFIGKIKEDPENIYVVEINENGEVTKSIMN